MDLHLSFPTSDILLEHFTDITLHVYLNNLVLGFLSYCFWIGCWNTGRPLFSTFNSCCLVLDFSKVHKWDFLVLLTVIAYLKKITFCTNFVSYDIIPRNRNIFSVNYTWSKGRHAIFVVILIRSCSFLTVLSDFESTELACPKLIHYCCIWSHLAVSNKLHTFYSLHNVEIDAECWLQWKSWYILKNVYELGKEGYNAFISSLKLLN